MTRQRVGATVAALDWTVVAGQPARALLTFPEGVPAGAWTATTGDDSATVDNDGSRLVVEWSAEQTARIVGRRWMLRQDGSDRVGGVVVRARPESPLGPVEATVHITDGVDAQVVVVSAGDQGSPGESAYEVAVAGGETGTEAEWLASLIGPEGPEGIQGDEGPQGVQGVPGDVTSAAGVAGVDGDVPRAGLVAALAGTTGDDLASGAVATDFDAHETLTTTAHGGIVAGTDARLSDARTPTGHADTHSAAGADPVTIAVGQLAATGVADADSVLHGDGRWAEPSGAGMDQAGGLPGELWQSPTQGGATTNTTFSAGRVFLAPYVVRPGQTWDAAAFHVASAVTDAKCHVVVYGARPGGLPGPLLFASGPIDAATTGLVTVVFPAPLTIASAVVFTGIYLGSDDAVPNLLSLSGSTRHPMGIPASNINNGGSAPSGFFQLSSTLPDPFTSRSSSARFAPIVYLRKAP